MPPYVYALMAHGVVGFQEGDLRGWAPVDHGGASRVSAAPEWALWEGLAALRPTRKAASGRISGRSVDNAVQFSGK